MNKLPGVDPLLASMGKTLAATLSEAGRTDPLMVGIHTGGSWVATRLHRLMRIKTTLATLNIAFYRDDFSRIGLHPKISPSSLPLAIEDRHIILVDDVLHTGRTIRAAMNEIFDYGRPASILLAVLIDRSGRELPIQAHVSGKTMQLNENEHVKLCGPKPLRLEIKRV